MRFGGNGRRPAFGRRPRGVHIDAVSERSPGSDEQLAALLRDMRLCLGASKVELARRLGTTPSVIDLLERGQVHRLPPWPETVLIITKFGALHGVDVRPILARIRQQVGPAGLGRVPAAPAEMPRIARSAVRKRRSWWARTAQADEPTARASAEQSRGRGRKRRVARVLFTLSAPVVLAVGGICVSQMSPTTMQAAMASLPEPAARIVRPVIDFIAVQLAPSRDGMRWIEVSNPRSRKGDKLRQAAR